MLLYFLFRTRTMLLTATTAVLWMHLGRGSSMVCSVTEGVTFNFKPHFLVRVGMSPMVMTTGQPATPRDRSDSMRVVLRSDCTASKEMDMRTSSRTVTETCFPGGHNFRAILAGITLGRDGMWTLDLVPNLPPTPRPTAPRRSGTVHSGHQCVGWYSFTYSLYPLYRL